MYDNCVPWLRRPHAKDGFLAKIIFNLLKKKPLKSEIVPYKNSTPAVKIVKIQASSLRFSIWLGGSNSHSKFSFSWKQNFFYLEQTTCTVEIWPHINSSKLINMQWNGYIWKTKELLKVEENSFLPCKKQISKRDLLAGRGSTIFDQKKIEVILNRLSQLDKFLKFRRSQEILEK